MTSDITEWFTVDIFYLLLLHQNIKSKLVCFFCFFFGACDYRCMRSCLHADNLQFTSLSVRQYCKEKLQSWERPPFSKEWSKSRQSFTHKKNCCSHCVLHPFTQINHSSNALPALCNHKSGTSYGSLGRPLRAPCSWLSSNYRVLRAFGVAFTITSGSPFM